MPLPSIRIISACWEAACLDRLYQRRVVTLCLVGIRDREFLDCNVERIVFSQVASDSRGISRPRVRARQRPSTNVDVLDPILLLHIFQLDGHFHVAKLAEIIVAALVIARPAKKDVARRLQHVLARHYSFAMIAVPALARVRLEHGWKRLLELQEEGVTFSG